MMINDAARLLAHHASHDLRVHTAIMDGEQDKARDLILGRMHNILLGFGEDGGITMDDSLTDACATLLSCPGLRVMIEMRLAASSIATA